MSAAAALTIAGGGIAHADDTAVDTDAPPPVGEDEPVVAVGLPPVPPTTVVVAVGPPPVPPTTAVETAQAAGRHAFTVAEVSSSFGGAVAASAFDRWARG